MASPGPHTSAFPGSFTMGFQSALHISSHSVTTSKDSYWRHCSGTGECCHSSKLSQWEGIQSFRLKLRVDFPFSSQLVLFPGWNLATGNTELHLRCCQNKKTTTGSQAGLQRTLQVTTCETLCHQGVPAKSSWPRQTMVCHGRDAESSTTKSTLWWDIVAHLAGIVLTNVGKAQKCPSGEWSQLSPPSIVLSKGLNLRDCH